MNKYTSVKISTSDSIQVGNPIGVILTKTQGTLEKDVKYTLQFKIINYSNVNILDYIYVGSQKLSSVNILEGRTTNTIDGREMKLCYVDFIASQKLVNPTIKVGRLLTQDDTINTLLYEITDFQLERGFLTDYNANVNDLQIVKANLESKINQLADSLEFMVTKNEYDNLGNSVSTALGMIEVTAGEISLKVEKADIDNAIDTAKGEISKEISNVKSEIKITTDAISQNVSNLSQTVSNKADGSTVTSINNKVGSLETSVNGISGKVSNVEATTTTLAKKVDIVQGTADSAVSKADSAQNTANTAKNTANANKNNIVNLQGEVSTVKDNIASLEVTTSGISQKVSSVESTTATLSGKVNTANTNATNALNKANSANTLADSKAKVFTSTPTVPYKVGDLWVQGTSGDVMRCKTARASGSYTASDWEKASKYTDDTKANAVDGKLTTLQGEYNTTKSQVAEINTNLDSITQRVSSTESTVSSHTTQLGTVDSRINTAKNSAISTASSDATTKANNALASAKTDATTKANNALADAKTYTNGQITTVNTTINNKVAEIKATTDAITQRVSSTESTVTTHTTQLGTVDSRINTAKNQAIVDARKAKDTRSTNENPQWYFTNYPRQTITEFKYANVIGIGTSAVYGTLETKVPWNDASGGYPVQTFRSNSTATYERKGTSTTAWGAWKQIEDISGSQAKANQALTDAKAFTTTEVSKTNNKVASIETNLNSITSRVSSVENSTTTINGNVTNLQNRVNTAEQKITDSAIVSTVTSSQTYKNGLNGKVSTNQVISSINQTAEAIKISANKLDLTGDLDLQGRFKCWKSNTDKTGNYLHMNGAMMFGYNKTGGSNPVFASGLWTNENMGYFSVGYTRADTSDTNGCLWISPTTGNDGCRLTYSKAVGSEVKTTNLYFKKNGTIEFATNMAGMNDTDNSYTYLFDSGVSTKSLKCYNLRPRNIIPLANGTYDLGRAGARFKDTYTDTVSTTNHSLVLGTVTDSGAWQTYGGMAINSSTGYVFPNSGNGNLSLGSYSNRFHTLFSINAVNASSDKRLKTDIHYLDEPMEEVQVINGDVPRVSKNMNITTQDMYDFVKNDLKLASYRYKANIERGDTSVDYNFIAQDILYTKVGSEIVQLEDKEDLDSLLSYNQGNYISVVVGALQKEIELRDKQIANLEERLSKLESKLK